MSVCYSYEEFEKYYEDLEDQEFSKAGRKDSGNSRRKVDKRKEKRKNRRKEKERFLE